MTKHKFEIPYNFDKTLIDSLHQYKQHVKFVYMPTFYKDSHNSRERLVLEKSIPTDYQEYLSHIDYILTNGFDIGLLIQENSNKEIIEKYYQLGIRTFIINNNQLAKEFKELYNDTKFILSITSISTAEYICNNDLSMYDGIVLYFNFCRQIQELEKLPKEYKYTLLINSHCIYNCDRSLSHWRLTAPTFEEYEEKELKITIGHCGEVYREDRAFVPPEDLSYFEDYVDSYKLVDRLYSSSDIVDYLVRYINSYNEHRKDKSWYMLGDS